jgi:hypothetical protein
MTTLARRALMLLAFASAPTAVIAADASSIAAPTFRTGDEWLYHSVIEQGTTGFTEGSYEVKVQDVRDDALVIGIKREGAPTDFQDQQRGLDWSEQRLLDGKLTATDRPYAFPMAVGKTWDVDYDDPTRHGLQTSTHVHRTYKVTGWEDVTTPAGTFHAIKVEVHGTLKAQIAASNGGVGGIANTPGSSTAIVHTQNTPAHVEYATTYARIDYAPEVKSFVKSIHETYNAGGVRIHSETRTLESFKPAA